MENYKKMYAILCAAVDEVIDPLEKIPAAVPWAARLRAALHTAEELYIWKEQSEPIALPRCRPVSLGRRPIFTA